MKPHFVSEDFDPMVDNPENYRLGIFYFNRKDKRAVVPKQWMAGIVAVIIFALVMGSL